MIIKKIFTKLKYLVAKKSFVYFDTKVFFPKNSIIYQKYLTEGVYEKENIKIIINLLSDNSFYFDIGANIGLMAIPILKKVDSCTVVSFEPSPNSVSYLKRTLKGSLFTNRWFLIEKAVGAEMGELEFCFSFKNLGAYDGFRNTNRMPITGKTTVPVTTIDLEWKNREKPKVSVIKIDVEGAEMEVLKGAIQCIQQEKPSILIEWNMKNLQAYNSNPEELVYFADKYNYQVYSIPDFNLVNSPNQLLKSMEHTESFLLCNPAILDRKLLIT
ncbi:FkbM family methyltransferase [Nodularia harveyana UHCC-0300]|uniref:FkbM family methyltransferase n=1 Tax=Nodularia harveyana UHCC-0300 TaxID=2974287 RepID=A0ABU5UC82_9CYAN|nr:FkbM family methyltransferase [Nodularia harveyana]MEA5581127.1 FkbM family methyltransferase [Nodularia harveyana UHCC-0300]